VYGDPRCWHSVRPPRCLCPARYWLCRGIRQGAYSAGVLNAWSRQGGRPSFDIVTGVSTGSLIAPFAFLGEQEDGELKAIYTGVSRKDIYHQRILSGLFGGPSLMSTRPLQALIARHITPALLDRIAAQHRRGRRLLVMTTNLDAERGVIWDMGAIAASDTSDRLSLFRQVLLASASIPGVFPRCSSMPMRMVIALRKCMSMEAR
jgi:predicted acylesterase/phospholipase RssA